MADLRRLGDVHPAIHGRVDDDAGMLPSTVHIDIQVCS
jgi:hypothetical protein